jgi:hypothetical protein
LRNYFSFINQKAQLFGSASSELMSSSASEVLHQLPWKVCHTTTDWSVFFIGSRLDNFDIVNSLLISQWLTAAWKCSIACKRDPFPSVFEEWMHRQSWLDAPFLVILATPHPSPQHSCHASPQTPFFCPPGEVFRAGRSFMPSFTQPCFFQ